MIFNLNATLIIFVISFLVFMWLLNKILLQPVGDVIEKRNKLIEGELEAGRLARADAQLHVDRYEQELQQIREQAQTLILQATSDANKDRAAQLDRVSAAGQGKIEKAKADLVVERERLIDSLVSEQAELVETITKKALGDESHVGRAPK